MREDTHSMRTNSSPIAIMRRSCSDSLPTASQLDRFSEATGIAIVMLQYDHKLISIKAENSHAQE
jgi:hypothetical protein